jgi:hypothetical protein
MAHSTPSLSGLSSAELDKLEELQIGLMRIRRQLEELGEHKIYTLVSIKIEEAEHWLQARKSGVD